MKSLREIGPRELAGLRQRTLREYAMGRIAQPDCDAVVSKIDDLMDLIVHIKENK